MEILPENIELLEYKKEKLIFKIFNCVSEPLRKDPYREHVLQHHSA